MAEQDQQLLLVDLEHLYKYSSTLLHYTDTIVANGASSPSPHWNCAVHQRQAATAGHPKRHSKCKFRYQCSVESLLLVGGDGAVGGGVGHAGQHEALAHLVIIQERLVGLVHSASVDLAGARRAGTSAARVGQVNACKR